MRRSVRNVVVLLSMCAWATSGDASSLTEGVGDGAGGFYACRLRRESGIYLGGTLAVTAPIAPVENRVFRFTNSGAIAPGWPADGVPPSVGPSRAERALVVADGAGGVVVVWADGLHLDTRILAQRIAPDGARQWGAGGVIVVGGAGYRTLESAIADGAGGVLIGWQESGSDPLDSESDLRAQRLTSAGSVASGWATGGVELCAAAGRQQLLKLVSDGGGGLIACWWDGRGFNPVAYAQHVNGSGAILWAADGISTGLYPVADIAADGASGAFLTSVTGGYVVAQRIDATGSPLWTPGGVALSDIGNLIDPRVISDGEGGAIVHWAEQPLFFPPPMPALKAQRVTSAGTIPMGWPTYGRYLGDSLSFGSFHLATTDGLGGFLFAWTDFRAGAVVSATGDTLRSHLLRPRAQRLSGNAATSPGWPPTGIRVSRDSAQVSGFDLTFVGDGSGGAMLAWEDVRSGYFGQRLNDTGVKQWGSGDLRLVSDPVGQSQPAIGSDGAGGALVGWMRVAPGSLGAFARRIDAAGALAPETATLGPPRGYLSTLVAPDGSGGNFVFSGAYSSGFAVQRFDASGNALWDTAAVVGQSGGVAFPQGMVGDGTGGVYVFWLDQSYLPTVQRFDATGHAPWPAVQPLGTDPYVFLLPGGTLVADGAGGVVLVQPKPVNTGLRQYKHVWVQRVDASGAALWGATGIEALGGDRDHEFVRAATDGAGGVLLAWTGDAIDASADIRAHRVDGTGNPAAGWPAGGMLVCAAGGRQLYPDIAAVDSGGCIIAWTDARGAIPQVYAQALDSSGAARWTADGIPLGPGSGAQYLQQLVPDASSGAIAMWMDTRGVAWGLRAQRVSDASSLLWGAGGLDVGGSGAAPSMSTLGPPLPSGNLSAPVLAPDTLGGAVVAWQEPASPFEYVVRAQRITPGGTLAWPDGVTGTLAGLVSAHASPGLVRIEWFGASARIATIERSSSPAAAWTALASVAPNGDGRYVFEDRDVEAGRRYGYRLVFSRASGAPVADEVWLDVPAALDLGFAGAFPNPATDEVWLAFTLRSGTAASLEVFDITGRRVIERDLTKLGPGSHRLLAARSGELEPGVYLARLTEAGARRNRRFAVTR